MKKRRTFDIGKWQANKEKNSAKRREFLKLLAGHPLPWFVLIMMIVYGSAALGLGQ